MSKELKEKMKGVVTKKYLPRVYENGNYLDEELIDIIGLEVDCNGKKIKLIKPRKSNYSKLFVKDKVVICKYLSINNYEGYKDELRQHIYNYNSENKHKEEILSRCLLSKEEFEQRPIGIIDYEIEFE